MKTIVAITICTLLVFTFSKVSSQTALLDTLHTKYYQGNVEPPANWKDVNFNDSSWNPSVGEHMYTYGETYFENKYPYFISKLSKNTTAYFRYTFNVGLADNYKELVMHCDFDDGFVAYINGAEFARVNMGKQVSSTTISQLADRAHDIELLTYENYAVTGYYIDEDFMKDNLVIGENILSVEVHNNTTANGDDLGFYCCLYDMTNTYYNLWGFEWRYKKYVQLDSTKLPIVVIETDQYGIPHKRIEVDGTIGIIHNNQGNYNKPEHGFNHLFSSMTIEQRGESSADFPKKSYDFELHDLDGNDTSIAILGMPREADWILQGPYADKSQIRNALFYELARKTGQWTPRLKFCEVIVNGEYVGLYNLIEKIKRDSNRVNIAKLRPEEISGTDLTGGYILKWDKGSNNIQIVYPKGNNLQDEQENYIRNHIKQYESVLYSNQGLDPEIGYKKYIDETSLIDYMIVAELGKNCDSYLYSSYFYKDKDDRDPRIKYGPIWDFDLCMGNATWQDGDKLNKWQFAYPSNKRFHIKRLLQDTAFVKALSNRWFELRQSFLHNDSLFNRINELGIELADAISRNYEVWPIIDKNLFHPAYNVSSYNQEIAHIKSWLTSRLEWMDNNIGNIYYPVTPYANVNDQLPINNGQFHISNYPNPFSENTNFSIKNMNFQNADIEIYNMSGVLIETIPINGNTVEWKTTNIKSGIYLYRLKANNYSGQLQKMIKVY